MKYNIFNKTLGSLGFQKKFKVNEVEKQGCGVKVLKFGKA